jgi:hypothetical protein
MTERTGEGVDPVALPNVKGADALDMLNLTEEDALILWRYGGYGTPENFPGARLAPLFMLRGVDKAGRRAMARLFASLAPHAGIRAVLALLRALTIRPALIALPAPAPLALSPQRRCHRFSPARAP